MAADQIELRTTTFTKGHGWLDSYGTLLRDNDILLGRGRWTTGETVLAQVDCQPGAWQIQPGDRILRHWRVDGTTEADDEDRLLLSTPIRGSWHWLDSEASPGVRGAFPPLDNRVVRGDSILVDTEVAGSESYVLHYGSAEGRFWGRGVLCESREVATAIAPTKSSGAVTLRGSYYSSGAKWMDWRLRNFTPTASTGLLRLYAQHEGGSEQLRFQFISGSSATFEIYGTTPDNIVPGIRFNSYQGGGSPAGVVCGTMGVGDGEADGVAVWFQHGDPTRRALWRFRPSSANAEGADSVVLVSAYREYATGGDTLIHSGGVGWVASYWDGAAAQEAAAYAQHVLTGTDPAGYLRHGFGYGVGTSDHYSDGAVLLTMDREGASAYGGALTIAPHEVSGPSTADFVHSPYFSALAYSGIAGSSRVIAWNAQIDSDADADDRWSLRFVAVGGGGPSEILGVRDTGEIIPADGSAGVLELSAALGTHSGTTASDVTGNAVLGGIKIVDASGTVIAVIPAYAPT